MDSFLVHIIAALAFLYLLWWLGRNFFGLGSRKKGDIGCGSCPQCGPEAESKSPEHGKAGHSQ